MPRYRHKDTHEVVAAYGPSTEGAMLRTADEVSVPIPEGVFFAYEGGSELPTLYEASVFTETFVPQNAGDAEAPASSAGE